MRFGILGPLEVADEGGRQLELGGRKQRAVLAILLLHANEPVSPDRLVEDLWSGRPPASAATSLQAHVSRLRRALGADQRIVTTGGGYLVRVAPGELDRERFERLVEEGGAAIATEDWKLASARLREALGLWRGAALSEFAYESFAQAEIARLGELHVGAVEQWLEAELALGREATVIGELERLVREHPYRERLRGQLMLALYRTGRQAEALAAYRNARGVLVEELGIEPSPELRELHEAILTQDSSLLWPGEDADRARQGQVRRGDAAPSPVRVEASAAREDRSEPSAAAPVRETERPRQARKVVTALFCDVTGSTALGEQLDPEVWREVLNRYFVEIRKIIERHGGTVEKFIGDAVMAVFGIPRVREDDALRAVRAAAEIRKRVPAVAADVGVELRFRTGVNTGPVLMAEGENLAVGDAVNVAARLEQTAEPGEIVIGEDTFRLVRDAVRVEALEPLELSGKAQRAAAYRLVSVDPAAPGFARRLDAPLVGREDELRLLREVWERARRESGCYLFTLLGMAGVGKSRLVAELLTSIADRATVLWGRCLHYGEGITFWPVVEALTAVGERAEPVLEELRGGGLATREELFWEVRRLLEALAAEQPVLLYIDDLQWAEPTLLDLLDHVADLSRDAPILVLCTARPELLEDRPAWGGGKLNTITLLLQPLAAAQADALLDQLGDGLDPAARSRVIAASEGNPLFLEEMVALARERGIVEVPPTIQALLAARLERLAVQEREVLERGAIEGEVFHRSAVRALADEQLAPHVDQRLAGLVRKELIRPHPPTLAGDEAFRFRHLLIRDAAYDALPKSRRAELHERFASWLEQHTPGLIELDEILGYHLEQACRYRAELRLSVNEGLKAVARDRLTDAGRRADLRHDYGAAASLLERAASLVPEGELDLRLEVELVEALISAGRGADAVSRAAGLAERAGTLGDRIGELCGKTLHGKTRAFLGFEGATRDLEHLLEEALPLFEASGDDLALFVGYYALSVVATMRMQREAGLEAYERAAFHSRRAGTSYESQIVKWRADLRLHGTTPIPELLDWLDEQESQGVQPLVLKGVRAAALASVGQIEEAREVRAEYEAELADHGDRLWLAGSMGSRGTEVDLLAGDAEAAVRYGQAACLMLEEMGQRGILSTMAGLLAGALCDLDRLDEAGTWARQAAELGTSEDVATQFLWRQAKARMLARRGEHAEAERLGREAVAIADTTDDLRIQGDAYVDLAEVLSLAGRPDDAADMLRGALDRYERKGVLVMVKRTRQQLQALQERTVAR